MRVAFSNGQHGTAFQHFNKKNSFLCLPFAVIIVPRALSRNIQDGGHQPSPKRPIESKIILNRQR